MIDAILVDRVVAAAKRDDSRPGNTKSVGLCPKFLQESDIFCSTVVRVARNSAISAVANPARSGCELVPMTGY